MFRDDNILQYLFTSVENRNSSFINFLWNYFRRINVSFSLVATEPQQDRNRKTVNGSLMSVTSDAWRVNDDAVSRWYEVTASTCQQHCPSTGSCRDCLIRLKWRQVSWPVHSIWSNQSSIRSRRVSVTFLDNISRVIPCVFGSSNQSVSLP